MVNSEVITTAVQKKYTEFSKLIKSELHSKLSDNEDIAKYSAETETMQILKTQFADINASVGA